MFFFSLGLERVLPPLLKYKYLYSPLFFLKQPILAFFNLKNGNKDILKGINDTA